MLLGICRNLLHRTVTEARYADSCASAYHRDLFRHA